ncbi:MAG: ATP-binding cassette domain-containing protein [Clostridia bacterium]|nr:ATP-binding cassette domain-containing protein [Clostridia bacterium]
MSLLSLKDIGKIYVSEGNVSVGIRGVNLSFDKGEFVAITGQSGSGKSTLLNVISGMDSYEEGELYIEGQTTSHYLQPEWEEYREKYISFIFQDYNIIESFTVLQNVELALMHIDDKRARRKKAVELLTRVGLKSHLNHKGSRLSGGQKQRCVIARALAKDSPIILADEPTGNLDSQTSREIIALLREVSRDKLLIVVTHDFDDVAECATRHIRVFDGSVEFDRSLREKNSIEETEALPNTVKQTGRVKKTLGKSLQKGIQLGKVMFTSRPRLSVFLCALMIIGTLGIFLVTGISGNAAGLFEKSYMFTHMDGRVVFTRQDGAVISDEEFKLIVEKYGAEKSVRYDVLLDDGGTYAYFPRQSEDEYDEGIIFNYTYGEDFGDRYIGKYPESANEVFLSLPISYKTYVGKSEILRDKLIIDTLEYTVVGVHYYVDNNLTPKCLFTEEGFKIATAVRYMAARGDKRIAISVTDASGAGYYDNFYDFAPSFSVEKNKMYVTSEAYHEFLKINKDKELNTDLYFATTYYTYDYYTGISQNLTFEKAFNESWLTDTEPEASSSAYYYSKCSLYVSPYILIDIAEGVLSDSYAQASLFFESDAKAHQIAEQMCADGYIAVTSDTTYSPDTLTLILNFISAIFSAIMWVVAIVFLAFFINLCSGRALDAFKGDLAIMRSMGITAKVIKIAMHARMLITLIPAYLMVIGVGILIFTTPRFNDMFTYLYPWQYGLIFIGVFILTVRVTKKQIGRIFGESVKKSLRGGSSK